MWLSLPQHGSLGNLGKGAKMVEDLVLMMLRSGAILMIGSLSQSYGQMASVPSTWTHFFFGVLRGVNPLS